MNLEEEIYSSALMDMHHLRGIIADVIKIIENSSGKIKKFNVTEKIIYEAKPTRPLLLSSSLPPPTIATTVMVNYLEIYQVNNPTTDITKKLVSLKLVSDSGSGGGGGGGDDAPISVYTCIKKQTHTRISTVGDFLDYLFWSLCPSLCAIRSIMYMMESCKKAMNSENFDGNLVFSIDKDKKKGEGEAAGASDDDYDDDDDDDDDYYENQHISFFIYRGSDFVQIKIAPDLTHLICFPNGDLTQEIVLPQIHTTTVFSMQGGGHGEDDSSDGEDNNNDNTITMEKEIIERWGRGVCYLEQISFADPPYSKLFRKSAFHNDDHGDDDSSGGGNGDYDKEITVVPNPQISKVVKILLEIINNLPQKKHKI